MGRFADPTVYPEQPVTRAGRRAVGRYAYPERIAAVEKAERERVLAIARDFMSHTDWDAFRFAVEGK